MEAYVKGDDAAFERLFGLLAPSLRAFFLRSVGNVADAEDLMQTTLLKVHGARDHWRRGERLRPWLFTIAARVRIDWLRRKGRVLEEQAGEEDPPQPVALADEGDGFLARERAERVRAAVDSLGEPQRTIVHLHRFEGLTFAEIGRVLGLSEGAAKLRAFRAYEQLRQLLRDLVAEGAA
jgi:RNA polymerase sigma-70 factor (ECF subfamily)